MRQVHFALGPWEQFPDGHPPEKSCEEERRAYRHGLTLQPSKELSFLEQGILWFEASFQSAGKGSGSDGGGCDESTHLLGTSVAPDWPGANMEEYNASLLGRGQNRAPHRHDSVTSLEEYLPGLDKKSLEQEVGEWDSESQRKASDNKFAGKGCENVFITIPPEGLASCRGDSTAFQMEDAFYNGYVASSYPCGIKRMVGGVLLVMAIVVAMTFFQT